jgi:hypothetical protein
MNCDKAKSLLGWYYDGELSAADRKLLADHIEGCPECAAELAGLAELDGASRHLFAPEPPTDLWDQTANRLGADESRRATRFRVSRRRRFLLACGGLAASALASVLLYRQIRPSNHEDRNGVDATVKAGPDQSGQQDPNVVNLALLGPEDRHLVETQKICLADGCGTRLGVGGQPVKTVLLNEPVFFCCEDCEHWGQAHPKEVIAKLHELETRHNELEKRP